MRKKPSEELLPNDHQSKKIQRLKSPISKKIVKRDYEGQVHPKNKLAHSRQQVPPDSNNTTACTKSKNSKLCKKGKPRKEEGKNEIILHLIAAFAIKIQRQWRVHILRKKWKNLIACITKGKKQTRNQLCFDPSKLKRHFHEEQVLESDKSRFNSLKYQSQSSSLNSYRALQTQKALSLKVSQQASNITEKTPRQFLCNSENKPIETKQRSFIKDIPQQQRRATFSGFQFREIQQPRRHSTGEVKTSLKKLNIDKVYDIHIQHQPTSKSSSIMSKVQQNDKDWSPSERRGWDEGVMAFRQKVNPGKLVKKYKQDLQNMRFKRLLSLQSKFKKSQVTYRSYLDLVGKINQDHSSKLKLIRSKQHQFKQVWGQLLDLYRYNKEGLISQFKDQQQISKIVEQNPIHLDLSISFDKWDFNSSVKKSHEILELPDSSSKAISIERVLRELDEEENDHQINKFKKNKSNKVIEAIAERSKEISEEDIQFCQVNFQNKKFVTESSEIKIDIQNHNREEISNFSENQQQRISIDLIISQNQYRENKLVNFGKEQSQAQDIKNIERENQLQLSLIHHEKQKETGFKKNTESTDTNLVKMKEESTNDKLRNLIIMDLNGQLFTPQKQQNQIEAFTKMVEEVIILNRIRVFSTVKNWLNRVVQLKKTRKIQVKMQQKVPVISTDMDAVNTWLLEISHFILDNHQEVLRQNLFRPRQLFFRDLFYLIQKQMDSFRVYAVIPEALFKQFQTNYIETQWKNSLAACNEKINRDLFFNLAYDFHRVLIDSLNLTLMEQMSGGKDWLRLPWITARKQFERKPFEEVKVSLQKSINVVSNWAQYGLGRLEYSDENSQLDNKNYEDEKIQLVVREQVLQYSLKCPLTESNCIIIVSQHIYRVLAAEMAKQLATLSKNFF